MKTIKQLKHWRKIHKEQGYSIQSMELAFNQAMDYIETMDAMFAEFRKRATLDPEHPVMIENAKLKEALRVFKKLSDEIQADAERQQVFDLLGQELWMEI